MDQTTKLNTGQLTKVALSMRPGRMIRPPQFRTLGVDSLQLIVERQGNRRL